MATNFEFYKDEIRDIYSCNEIMAVKDNQPAICIRTECEECAFKPATCRGKDLIEWLLAEHIEQPKLTKRERAFCEAVQTGWIARDKNGDLTWFGINPDGYEKRAEMWGFGMARSGLSKIHEDWCEFAFIKWEDEKPWAVEDLLKLEVQEDA